MFRRLDDPLPLSEASLLVLRPALNAPVLNAGFLPVGPARAALVVFAEEWGGIGIALGIRSNESGQVAVFRNRESIDPDVPIPTALEPALAESEKLGFLFDEDMVAAGASGGGRSQAFALWGRLMGELELPPAPRAAPKEPAATEPIHELPPRQPLLQDAGPAPGGAPAAELVLQQVAEAKAPEIPLEELTLDDEVAPIDELVLDAAAPEPPRPAEVEVPAQQLSKFRHAEDGDAQRAGQLGRIPLVRVKQDSDGNRSVPYLARLLASF